MTIPGFVHPDNLNVLDFIRDEIAKQYNLRGDLVIGVVSAGGAITVTKKDGTTETLVTAVIGEMKQGLMTSMPAGWVRMMGQEVSSLTASQQAVLASLRWGAGGYLNVDDMVLSSTTGITLGSVDGSNSITIGQDNLPSCTFTGSTSSASHTHTVSDNVPTFSKAYASGTASVAANSSTTQTRTTSSNPHSHTVSVGSGGSGTPINTTPARLIVSTWIYLGE